jgi:predicted HAD superfamily hydrolase
MYNEQEYIYLEFTKHFTDKSRPIALYGIGKNTRLLLPKIRDYNIIGLMDGEKKSGEIEGVPIIDYDQLLIHKVKDIILIARPVVRAIIYYRIADFCHKNKINIWDINGNDLSKTYANKTVDNPYYQLNWNDLEVKCEEAEIISFDIFDTLIARNILYPKDIFSIVEMKIDKEDLNGMDFADLRIKSEESLLAKGLNPNIYEIYDEMQRVCGFSHRQKEIFLNLEIETELAFIVPRKSVLDFYNEVRKGKKVYFISNMYLPKEILKRILSKCGYEGYEDILVSCDYRKSKNEGLFNMFRKEVGIEKKCLHIGDNYRADYQAAKSAGMDSFLIMSGLEMLTNSTYAKLLSLNLNIFDRVAVGIFINEAFNDPFALYNKNGKTMVRSVDSFTKMFIAPIIVYFTIWFIQNVEKEECDYIFYPARDAFLIQKLCDFIVKTLNIEDFPNGQYLYASRRAVLAATVFDSQDIINVAKIPYKGSIKDMFKERFNIEIDEESGEYNHSNDGQLNFYLEKYQHTILESCKLERENYLKYLRSLSYEDAKKIAFIDLVAAGRVQDGIEKLMPEKTFQGFYFLKKIISDGNLKESMSIKSFYPAKGNYLIDYNVFKCYQFLEIVMTSYEGTFHMVGKNNSIVLRKDNRSEKHLQTLKEIHNSIFDYCKQVLDLYPNVLSAEINKETPDCILGFLSREYTTINAADIIELNLNCELSNQQFNIFKDLAENL